MTTVAAPTIARPPSLAKVAAGIRGLDVAQLRRICAEHLEGRHLSNPDRVLVGLDLRPRRDAGGRAP
jgi:hypothetical protein